MEQQLGFALASDGTKIGYTVTGEEGPALIFLTTPSFSHALRWPANPLNDPIQTVLCPGRRFIWVDLRGTGVSSRGIDDFSLDSLAGDVVAVAEALRLDSFDLFACDLRAPVAVRLATAHRDLLNRLVLWNPWFGDTGWLAGTREMRSSNFDEYTRTMATIIARDTDRAELLTSYMRQCIEQRDLVGMTDAFLTYQLSGDLLRVTVPVLILSFTYDMFQSAPDAAIAARAIADARVVVAGRFHDPAAVDRSYDMAADFFGRPTSRAGASAALLTRSETAVLALLASGLTNAEIAAKRTVAQATVATQVQHIFRKIGAGNRVEAAAWAVKHGLV